MLENQGFMQDKIIASHVTHVLVDTWMLTLKCLPEMDYKHTCDTIFTHFQGITNNIYDFVRPFFAPSFFYPSTHISTRPYSFIPVQVTGMGLYIKLCREQCYPTKLVTISLVL